MVVRARLQAAAGPDAPRQAGDAELLELPRQVGPGTTTVRVSLQTHEMLKRLAAYTGTSVSDLLDRIVEEYRRDLFVARANDDYARLRANPEAWQEELEERRLWEATLKDGLEPQEWTDADVAGPAPR